MRISRYLDNIRKQDKPLKFITSKFLIRTKLSSKCIIQRKYFKIKFFENSEASRLIWTDNNYVLDIEEFVEDYLKEGDVMIDIGANIGLVTLTSSSIIGQHGKAYSIEAHPTIFQNLLENIKINNRNNIHTFNTAIGNKTGKVIFSNIRSDTMNSIKIEGTDGISISMKKLDDLPISETSISLIKIDVEGYEKFVLDGGVKTLKITNCVYFEAIEKLYNKYGYTKTDIIKKMEKNGFKIFELNNKILSPINEKTDQQDLLAIKDINDFIKRTNYKISS